MIYCYFLLLLLAPLQIVAVKDANQINQADTTKKYNLRLRPARPSRRKAIVTAKKEPIPDLNFPPPIEEEETQKKTQNRRTYAQKILKHEKEGTLEAYREAERIRKKEYNARFTPEQLKARSRKHEEARKAKNAAVSKNC